MNRDEFVRMLGTEPATPNQIGAVRVEFRRLGLDDDRPARLAAVAAIVGVDSLGSVKDLSIGQAGFSVENTAQSRRRRGAGDGGPPGPDPDWCARAVGAPRACGLVPGVAENDTAMGPER